VNKDDQNAQFTVAR